MPTRLRCLKLALVLLSALVGVIPARAQDVTWEPPTRTRAHLGIEGTLTFRQDGRATTTIVLVTGTRVGTPAYDAKIVRGDSIVGINGRRLTVDRWADFRTGLEPGQEVRLTLLRNGEQREVLLTATATDQPFGYTSGWRVEIPKEVQIEVEAIQSRVLEAFEAARVRYAERPRIQVTLSQADSSLQATLEILQEARRGFSFSFRTGTTSGASSWVVSAPRVDWGDRDREPERRSRVGLVGEAPSSLDEVTTVLQDRVRSVGGIRNGVVMLRPSSTTGMFRLMPVAPLPVEFMRMEGEVADSLTGAYVLLRSEFARVQQEQQLREMELLAEARMHSFELQESDGLLSLLDGENRRIFSQLSTLVLKAEAVAEAELHATASAHVISEAPLGGTTNRILVRSRAGEPSLFQVAPRISSRVSARVVGQHFVMGAQLMELKPQLSEYFSAENGVLVVEVLEGTPAAEAGILPGDVIIRAGRYPVTEVDHVRRALAEGRDGLRFRIIRKGDTLTVRFGR